MDIRNRIQTFIETGKILRGFPLEMQDGTPHPLTGPALQAEEVNRWFTGDNIRFALNALGEAMSGDRIEQWLDPYIRSIERRSGGVKTIGVVTAGNIPLAGFHDFMSVLISGHRFCGKLSGQDNVLLPAIAGILGNISPFWEERIQFIDGPFRDADAIIATGSDNTYRYFENYFSRYPHIIRKSRNGIAILSGNESDTEMTGLASDIMLYFGLGCRSVSKIYIPAAYDIMKMLPFFEPWNYLIRHNKYCNNYEYQKSIRIVNKKPFTDFGNLLLTEEKNIVSPVSVLNYERYNERESLLPVLEELAEKIQCLVSASDPDLPFVTPGFAQRPSLSEYADGIDTLRFLLEEI